MLQEDAILTESKFIENNVSIYTKKSLVKGSILQMCNSYGRVRLVDARHFSYHSQYHALHTKLIRNTNARQKVNLYLDTACLRTIYVRN